MMTPRWDQDVERVGMDTDMDDPTISLGWIGWIIQLGPVALYGVWEMLGTHDQLDIIRLLLNALLIGLTSGVLCAWLELRATLMFPQAWPARTRTPAACAEFEVPEWPPVLADGSDDDAPGSMWLVIAKNEAT